MYNKILSAGVLAIMSATVWPAAAPSRPDDLKVKGALDVGGDTSIAGMMVLKGTAFINGAAQVNGGLSVGSGPTSGSGSAIAGGRVAGPTAIAGSALTKAATLNVVGNAAIHEDAQIAGTLFIGHAPPSHSPNATRPDPSDPKLRVWGNVAFHGDQSLEGNQKLTGNQAVVGNQSVTGSQRLAGSQTFGAKTRQMINLWNTDYGIGVQASGFYLRTGGDFFWYKGGTHGDENGDGGGGSRLMQLDGNGQLAVAAKVVTPVLQITGGADVAEPFTMSQQELPKGSVVVIDEKNEGQLKLSAGAYDRRVAGIVSGANGITPGISLSQQGATEGGQNVALSGRVYVLADAATGPIAPGDLLTTSDTPGHAMKVTDHTRAQGAVIGKAMSSLKDGKGMVLVLVSLQ